VTVRLDGDTIRLEGACRVEEAEPLTALLQTGVRPVDLSACESLHAAVAQVLLAFAPPLSGAQGDGFLARHLAPALARPRNHGPAGDNRRLGRYEA
jgi:hypothetical protein